MKTEKEWADFGKKIYDAAQSLFIDRPVHKVIIPFADDEGFICRVTVDEIPVYVELRYDEIGNPLFIITKNLTALCRR